MRRAILYFLKCFNFSTLKDNSRNEFKMYSTTKHGRVHLSNIKLSEEKASKYLWHIHSLPSKFEDTSDTLNGIQSFDDSFGGLDIPNCAATTSCFTSINTTLKSAAYFALFGLLGFSVVWLFLILCLICDDVCPSLS